MYTVSIIMYLIYIYAFINVRLNVTINILIHMNDFIYLGVYICTCIQTYKVISIYRGNRSIVMPGCKYIYMTKHEELGPQIGIT